MTTRAQIIAGAFARIGVANYEFDIAPEERGAARTMLDAMMARWVGEGVDLGYTPSTGDNDAVAMTTPVYADAAIRDNLAVEMAPDYGKTPSPQLFGSAKRGYELVAAKTLKMPVTKRGRPPIRGGGDWRYRFWGW